MVKYYSPKDAEDVAHAKPEMWLETPYIFDQVVDGSDCDTDVNNCPDGEEHSWWSYPEMELVGCLFVFCCAFNLIDY